MERIKPFLLILILIPAIWGVSSSAAPQLWLVVGIVATFLLFILVPSSRAKEPSRQTYYISNADINDQHQFIGPAFLLTDPGHLVFESDLGEVHIYHEVVWSTAEIKAGTHVNVHNYIDVGHGVWGDGTLTVLNSKVQFD